MKWLLPLLLLFTTNAAMAAWYNGDWAYRQKFTIDAGKVNGDLTDFPVYVDLSNFDVTNFAANGTDLRVTKSDEVTEVAREIVFFDGANGEMHFKAAGTLSGTTNSDWYLYYGNAGASDYATSATYGAENVWNSNYVAVWHNQEDPSGGAPQVLDSTSYSHDMTSAGTMTSGDNVAGKLSGYAIDYDGSDDYLTVGDSDALDTPISQTISVWVSTTNTTSGRPIISKLASGAGTSGGWAFNYTSTNQSAQYLTYNGTSATTSAIGSTQINTGSWFLIHGVQDGSTRADVYINGFSDGNDTSTAGISRGTHLVNQASRGNTGTKIAAKIDEVRVMSTNMTGQWIWTEYQNQSSPSTFYSVSAEENVPVDNALFFADFI
jgi:hypothetical protein